MGEVEIEEEIRPAAAAIVGRAEQTLVSTLGIVFHVLRRDRVVGSMPVDGRTVQPYGLLHGGASVALAETLASIGAWLNVDQKSFATVGLEINANHVRSVREGRVIGTATPLHRGASTQVWDIRIASEDGRLVCVSRCTLAVVPIDRKATAG
jgi:uncharacterized protein (TIGR00369 family)